ncbi:hypothetical protein [Streptomyces sp. NBC_01235]|uniref:hypothetical protein n=1 Tax=Streptomyces sp. NBC_01235 TaxID=2903788 RepID=UPI002E108E85|nr:hypothetical protein OG289_34260 [Streptomyces sp. NBC_01235]
MTLPVWTSTCQSPSSEVSTLQVVRRGRRPDDVGHRALGGDGRRGLAGVDTRALQRGEVRTAVVAGVT